MKKILFLVSLTLTLVLSACDLSSTITFNFETNGGNPIPSIVITPPNMLVMPSDPIKDGYTFAGWFFDETLTTTPFNQDNLSLLLDQTEIDLYAKWELSVYTITYIINEEATNLNITTFTIETNYTLSDLVKEDYTFLGWYMDSERENPITIIDNLTGNLTIYGFFEAIIDYFEVTWKNHDQTVLEMDLVEENTTPVYNGLVPTKPEDELYTYTFSGWSPQISLVTANITYIATFTQIEKEVNSFDKDSFNQIFGQDIYRLMPSFTTEDYVVINDSVSDFIEVYIDIFDWTESDALDYLDALNTWLAYDPIEDSWILGNYFIYIYEDTDTYPNDVVYGIAVYGDKVSLLDSMIEVIDLIEVQFNDNTISEWLTPLDNVFGISIETVSSTRIEFLGSTTSSDINTRYSTWKNQLISNGLSLDGTLSNTYQEDVLIYVKSESLHYALYISIVDQIVEFVMWSYNPNVETETLTTLSYMQSINAYEKASFGKSGLPSTGAFDVLVIPIEIKGTPFPSDYMQKLELVFNGTSASTGWESVSSYYYKSSFGLLNMNFDIVTKYVTTQTRSYYESFGSDGDQYAIYEALIALDDTIDFSQYDANLDDLIDSIVFVFSVEYDFNAEPWWAWVYAAQYGEASQIDTLDEKAFEYYMWASYEFLLDPLPNAVVTVNAETFIHEFGHLFGADDMYSYTEDYGPNGGMHMMDYNNGDFEPFHKLLFGWLKPYVATQGRYEVTLESYSLDLDGLGSAVVIPYSSTAFNDGDAFDEFIIIIFYTPNGLYEAHQGSEYVLDVPAIMVYHVDARMNANAGFWEEYFLYNNDGTSDFFAELLEVDKNNSLDNAFIQRTDVLRSGVFDLSSYRWHQGNAPIEITIELSNTILSNQTSVQFVLTVS